MSTPVPEYIRDAGACIVSSHVLDGSGRLKWMVREKPADPADTGWRFFADIDDEAFVNDPANLEVRNFNDVADIEPAVIAIYELPTGADLQLVVADGRRSIIDNQTGKPIA